MRLNMPITGFITGLLLPFVGMMIMYKLWGHQEGLFNFLNSLTKLKGMASKVLTLSILINLLPFLYCIQKRLDYALRGVFIATMLYALLIVLIMFVW
jgi:hypothetical protein